LLVIKGRKSNMIEIICAQFALVWDRKARKREKR
jgi:hypothetical protein